MKVTKKWPFSCKADRRSTVRPPDASGVCEGKKGVSHERNLDAAARGRLVYEYRDVTKLSIVYETDLEELRKLVPPELELTNNRLAINKIENGFVRSFGGRKYDLLCVVAFVRFGEGKDAVEGAYSLVMWENMFDPVMIGREALGVPKLIADLDPIVQQGDDHHLVASINSSTFLKVKATLTTPLGAAEIDKINQSPVERNINLRHLPQPSLRGAAYEDLILYQTRNRYTDGITGTAEFQWILPEAHESPLQEHIVRGLAALPCRKVVSATLTHKEFSTIEFLNGRILKVLRP